jgi:HlyD family secretion protein
MSHSQFTQTDLPPPSLESTEGVRSKERPPTTPAAPSKTPQGNAGQGIKKWLARGFIGAAILGAAAGLVLWRPLPWTVREPVDVLVLYGNVDIRDVQLAFNQSDRITRMRVKEGDRVEPGELLAELDTRRLKAAVARAEAQVAAQKQTLARLVDGTRPEEIRKARADVDLAKAELDNARRTSARRQSLAAKKAGSQQDSEDAQAAAATADARLAAAQATLDLAIAGPRKEDISEARATLEALEAQLASARVELADASLYAASAGVIQERLLEPGDMASPQKPVFTIALTDPVWVRAYVAEPDLGKLSLGMTAEVETDSFPGKRYEGWVGFISPTAEFTPKSVEVRQLRTRLVYQARIFVKNPADELRLGMPATVRISLNQTRSVEGGNRIDTPRSR